MIDYNQRTFTKGEFRLRFTLDERAAREVYQEQARAAAAAGTATQDQAIFLAIEKDWDDGPEIVSLDDPNLIAGIDFYIQIGLLAVDRRGEVLGIRPEPESSEPAELVIPEGFQVQPGTGALIPTE